MSEVQILTLSCRDRAGITARVTGYLYDKGGNILEAQQYNDQAGGDFFMRVEFDPQAADPATIRAGFAAIADEYGMTWTLRAKSARRKVVLMVPVAIPMTMLTANLFTRLDHRGAGLVIGVMLVILVPLRRLLKKVGYRLSGLPLALSGGVYGFVTGGSTGAGVISQRATSSILSSM